MLSRLIGYSCYCNRSQKKTSIKKGIEPDVVANVTIHVSEHDPGIAMFASICACTTRMFVYTGFPTRYTKVAVRALYLLA